MEEELEDTTPSVLQNKPQELEEVEPVRLEGEVPPGGQEPDREPPSVAQNKHEDEPEAAPEVEPASGEPIPPGSNTPGVPAPSAMGTSYDESVTKEGA